MADSGRYNVYRLDLASLRRLLRNLHALEKMTDDTSMAILLDVRRALGDDPNSTSVQLSPRQRQVIQLHLIESLTETVVAQQLGIAKRVLYIHERTGLQTMLQILQNNERPTNRWLTWQKALLHDSDLTPEEIAVRSGKTLHAVECAMSRYRLSEKIPYRTASRQTSRRKSAKP